MRTAKLHIVLLFLLPVFMAWPALAQQSGNDTIRLGGIEVEGSYYPYVFLEEFTRMGKGMNSEDIKRMNILRSQVYATYSYALTAGTIFKKVHDDMAKMEDRRERKHYLKGVDKQLDACFKQPLKNLSIDQGHVLIKLINRQTGDNCYHVIKELKGGFSAIMWQSVGVFFNNNLAKDYDPQGKDKDIEAIAQELEASSAYRYQLFLQDEMMKRIGKK